MPAASGATILAVDRLLVERLEESLAALEDGDSTRVRVLARLAIELAYDPDEARRDHASRQAVKRARHVTHWGPGHAEARLVGAGHRDVGRRRAGDREVALQAATGGSPICSSSATALRCGQSSTPTPRSPRRPGCPPTPGTSRCGEPRCAASELAALLLPADPGPLAASNRALWTLPVRKRTRRSGPVRLPAPTTWMPSFQDESGEPVHVHFRVDPKARSKSSSTRRPSAEITLLEPFIVDATCMSLW